MSSEAPFDLAAGHRWFSATFFNATWDLMDKDDRTEEETEQMISLSHASLCHWRQRADCKPINLSVAYWQLARVYSLADRVDEAIYYAQHCLDVSEGVGAFYLGYAHEAMARAKQLAGDTVACTEHLAAARDQASLVAEADSRSALEGDLDSIAAMA